MNNTPDAWFGDRETECAGHQCSETELTMYCDVCALWFCEKHLCEHLIVASAEADIIWRRIIELINKRRQSDGKEQNGLEDVY